MNGTQSDSQTTVSPKRSEHQLEYPLQLTSANRLSAWKLCNGLLSSGNLNILTSHHWKAHPSAVGLNYQTNQDLSRFSQHLILALLNSEVASETAKSPFCCGN